MNKYVFLSILLIWTGNYLWSQTASDTLVLEVVTMRGNRFQSFTYGSKTETLDSASMQNHVGGNAATLLTENSQIFIKSYGLSGLATPSFRGSGAGHTAILWNGFALNSPMNGTLDLNLLPVTFIDQVKLHYGGGGALWGSGAIGGTVLLSNKTEYGKGWQVQGGSEIGSFGKRQYQAGLSYSSKKLSSNTQLFTSKAQNNFTFINSSRLGHPLDTNTNGATKQYGVLQEVFVKPWKRHEIGGRIWYQNNEREQAPSMTEEMSEVVQFDRNLRSNLEWNFSGKRCDVQFRSGLFTEDFRYFDAATLLDSRMKSRIWISEAETKFRIGKKSLVNLGVNYTNNQVNTSNYQSTQKWQNRAAVFGSYRWQNNSRSLRWVASFRKEQFSGFEVPITGSLGAEWRAWKHVKLRGSVSRNYRIPSLNDLYWNPGGNPDLKPEYGWSQEAGLAFYHCVSNFSLEAQATVVNSRISNWILWAPGSGAIWYPENIMSVWSRGTEYDLKLHWNPGKVNFEVLFQYNFIFTTTEKNSSDPESEGKQLIYVPAEKEISGLAIGYKKFRLSAHHSYAGYRYTSMDNKNYLDPFHLLNFKFSKTFIYHAFSVHSNFMVNNVFNTSYQSVAYYPVPGRNFAVGISVRFISKSKSTNKL
jgi:iron complex outermembrane receptor protein